MNKELHIIRHLYGEERDRAEVRRLLQDETLKEEYQALSEVKFALDHRPRARPDPQVIDEIVAAARRPSRMRQPDRPPRRRRAAHRTRWWQTAGALLAAVLIAGLGWWQFATYVAGPADSVAEREASTQQPAVEAAEPRAGQNQPAAPALAMQPEDEAESMPRWDEADELFQVHRRIELLQARSQESSWDEPFTPLDVRPSPGIASQPLQSGLRTASERQPGQ